MRIGTLDSFGISARDDSIAEVTLSAIDLPDKLLNQLIDFAYNYAPLVVVIDLTGGADHYGFTIAQAIAAVPQADLQWAVVALARLEPGWQLEAGRLRSPYPSQLRARTVRQILNESKNLVC